jgi:hypothetical protein
MFCNGINFLLKLITECFTDLNNLDLVKFVHCGLANFRHFCLKKPMPDSKVVKIDLKKTPFFISLNPWHTLYQCDGFGLKQYKTTQL